MFYLQIFRKSVEFCNEHEVWKLNVAHVLFMQVRIINVDQENVSSFSLAQTYRSQKK